MNCLPRRLKRPPEAEAWKGTVALYRPASRSAWCETPGGPLSAERQRVLAQELSHARAELECSRRAVRNLNEEMARMAVRTFRADDRRRRLREDNRRVQEHVGSTRTRTMAATTQGEAEVTEEQQRRRWRQQQLEVDHDNGQHYNILELETLLKKGGEDPESLARVYGELCGRCREAVRDFIES
ncbi:hypothetical protein PG999_013567 [Apiospora kogelbergensis]|uniref:Uncharacterized protein n=1 Tax=Apiospora kogelbergensis TaxID=1337665 RepID=A0AAW0QFS7_9PEZI